MIDRDDCGDREGTSGGDPLPSDLADIHRELDALRIEERASFGPELRAELETAWEEERRAPRRRRRSRTPALLAAGVGGLLLLGLSAPQARAALADIVGSVRESLVELVLPVEEDEARSAPSRVGAADVRAPARAPSDVVREMAPAERAAPDDGGAEVASPAVAVVFPDLLDREEASRLVQDFYPEQLRGTAVGGTVGLRMFVDAAGTVEDVRLVRSSGVAALDSAAVRAAPSLRFRPARKGRTSVGTWVELGIDFAPDPHPARGGAEASPR